jgi:hypothetical protein
MRDRLGRFGQGGAQTLKALHLEALQVRKFCDPLERLIAVDGELPSLAPAITRPYGPKTGGPTDEYGVKTPKILFVFHLRQFVFICRWPSSKSNRTSVPAVTPKFKILTSENQ